MRDLFRPARRVGGGNGTKFSLLAQNGPKSVFWGVLGEFCTGWAADPGRQGDVCCPARPDVGASAKKFTLRRSWMQRGTRGWLRCGVLQH